MPCRSLRECPAIITQFPGDEGEHIEQVGAGIGKYKWSIRVHCLIYYPYQYDNNLQVLKLPVFLLCVGIHIVLYASIH